jgi:hypothetical protein
MRNFPVATLADLRTPVQTGHLGVDPGLIEKNELLKLPASLLLPPALAGGPEVLPVLLGGVQRFFYSSSPGVPNGARGPWYPP